MRDTRQENEDNLYHQYRDGLLGEDIGRSVRSAVREEIADNEIAREWWANNKTSYTDAYAALVDGVISDYLSNAGHK